MVKIRLTRLGSHKKPYYRIVVADSRARRDGPFIEILGTYNPLKDQPKVKLNLERTEFWLKRGAQPTISAKKLIQSAG